MLCLLYRMLDIEIIKGFAHLSVILCRMKSSENKYLAVPLTAKKKKKKKKKQKKKNFN
jgi:hypothetical protein